MSPAELNAKRSGKKHNSLPARLFKVGLSKPHALAWGDAVALGLVIGLLGLLVALAVGAPQVVRGPDISLAPAALPWYTLLSLMRMTAAYALSLIFTLIYGRVAANNPRLEAFLIPLLDVLQSVPILSFLPAVLLSLSAILPISIAAELASIVLIFTSQVWNMTFAWYQSLTTIPKELREAGKIFRLNSWMRFKVLELPFAMLSLVWNSMMSWAGGWFFLMAAEIFTVGERDFRLPGLGAYMQEAAIQGNLTAVLWGLGTLVLVIVAMDQLIWRPLLTWADRFKVEMVESDNPPTSWFYAAIRSSTLIRRFQQRWITPLIERFDRRMIRPEAVIEVEREATPGRAWGRPLVGLALAGALLAGGYYIVSMLAAVSLHEWLLIAQGLTLTTLRVVIVLLLALAWTIPVGVAIGVNPRLAALLQPIAQVAASIPATALFPLFLLFILRLPQGMNIAAVLLMLMGTQWYLLFNIIAGASAIPQDLKYITAMMQLGRRERWQTLFLPALFPYLITGAITASGGAWNASIMAEYIHFSGQGFQTVGVGSLIAQATAAGDYPLLLAATLSLVLVVVLINRLVWQRLYRLAEANYRME